MSAYYHRYYKYKKKYFKLKYGGYLPEKYPIKNKFYYIDKYKQDVIYILNKYAFKKNFQRFNDLFIIWYIDSDKHKYIPNKSIVNVKDLEYFIKQKMGFTKDLPDIIKELNGAYDRFIINVKDAVREYPFIPGIMSQKQEERLKKFYIGDDYERDRNILTNVYALIKESNHHLSVPNIESYFELFGTPLNVFNSNYCSPFKIDRKFGSFGSFFEYEFTSNVSLHMANPPFYEPIMNRMSNRLLEILTKSNKQLSIIVILPIWDPESQKKYGLQQYHQPFPAFDQLINSSFLKQRNVVFKNKCKYYNHYTDKYVPASDTHVLLLANYQTSFDINEFIKKWIDISQKN